MMEIILVKDVDRLGKTGQVLTVKDGYARNYLIPQGLAVAASTNRRAQASALQLAQAKRSQALKEKALELADRLNAISCTIAMPVGDQEKLHGAVTPADIVATLADQGIQVDRHQVLMERPVTHLGVVEISVKLHPEVIVSLKIEVVKK